MQVLMTLERNGRADQSHGSQAEGTGLGPAERRETFLVNMEKCSLNVVRCVEGKPGLDGSSCCSRSPVRRGCG